MASSTKHFSLFLLLTLLASLHTHARESQLFNKIPPTTKNVVPESKQPLNNQQQEPNFLPENENNYGHDSATPTTTTTQPLHNKNYNPVAYVSEPEDINETTTFTEDDNKEEDSRGSNNYYYNGGSSFNSQPQGLRDTRFMGGAAFNGGGFRSQGMSDTRFLENGKYFYDVNREKHGNNHPYESLRANRERNEYSNNNLYGEWDRENAYEFSGENSVGGYQNQEEFQDEENNLP